MTFVMPMVRIRLKCADVDSFVDKYHGDINTTGMFVRTRSPLPANTAVSFELRLADDSCLFRGRGTVVWARPDDTLAPLLDAGMMLGFDELRDGTAENFARVLQRKRAMEEAADTVPTVVRTFTGGTEALPETTKMTAAEVEALRARMRAPMADDGPAPALPVELAGDAASSAPAAAAPTDQALPMLTPSDPRIHVEARPLPDDAPTPLAKLLVLRPRAAQRVDDSAAVDAHDITPLPPVARMTDTFDDSPLPALPALPPGDVTALIGAPARDRHATRLVALALAGWMVLLAWFAAAHLGLMQRMLDWINGA